MTDKPIYSRGKPEEPYGGEEQEPVHLMRKDDPLCRTGNWHIRHTKEEELVTCVNCQNRLLDEARERDKKLRAKTWKRRS